MYMRAAFLLYTGTQRKSAECFVAGKIVRCYDDI